jgi:threonine dehydrogenase-like Zn-dependent dehydrogenase
MHARMAGAQPAGLLAGPYHSRAHPPPCAAAAAPAPLQTDVILRVTSTAICGSDLHLYLNSMPGMQKGDVMGHEFMGVVEQAS